MPTTLRILHISNLHATPGTEAWRLQARGQLDEALRIRREEELPVYEKLSHAAKREIVSMPSICFTWPWRKPRRCAFPRQSRSAPYSRRSHNPPHEQSPMEASRGCIGICLGHYCSEVAGGAGASVG
jgi:hypothetical protein